MPASSDLLDLLQARSGIICAVGAGGKKSALYNLIARHPGRVGMTTTVHTRHFPAELKVHEVIATEDEMSRSLAESMAASPAERKFAFAAPSGKPGRYAGLSPELISQLHNECKLDATFVKADGARMRWLKAPRPDEPVLPPDCTTVISLVSVHAIGCILSDEIAHRVELITKITGLEAGSRVEPVHVAKLLASEAGGLKFTQGRFVVPVINMVDDSIRAAQAREVAEIALDSTTCFDRVVLTAMHRSGQPLVEVVTRN
jgi:probable selenium-dependent hydroxylase accessory protein YqeC